MTEWEGLSYSDRHIDLHVDGGRGEREYLATPLLPARAQAVTAPLAA